MADEQANGSLTTSENEDDASLAPEITIEAQYTKDLSFENPSAPGTNTEVPEISVDVTTGVRPIGDDYHETTLQFKAEAKTGEEVIFIVELTYGAVMKVTGVPQEAIGAVLLTEGARLIFPFARNIIADVTRDGGFPPLFLQPIDFIELYNRQHHPEG